MKLLFKQRAFSWFDSYDIYDENGNIFYTVKGQLSWGHYLKIFNSDGLEIAGVKEKVFSWRPKFELYYNNHYLGNIKREFSFFKPQYNIDFNGWYVKGNFTEWDYSVFDQFNMPIAVIEKQLFRFTDTYVIDVIDPENALYVLMLVIAIDAEKCSRND